MEGKWSEIAHVVGIGCRTQEAYDGISGALALVVAGLTFSEDLQSWVTAHVEPVRWRAVGQRVSGCVAGGDRVTALQATRLCGTATGGNN